MIRRLLLVLALLAVVAVAGLAPPATAVGRTALAGRWSWPTPPPHTVTTPFEPPAEVWSPGHRGVDVSAAVGTVVVAPDAGVVHFAGTVVDRPVLSLAHDGGVLSSFEPVRATVRAGDSVERGEPVGVVVAGHCAVPKAPCVHLGARVDGQYVSPLLLLGQLRPAVLLPTRPLP